MGRDATRQAGGPPVIVWTLQIPVGESYKIMRVERWETTPATGLWNWIRRRRTITSKTLVGLFMVKGRMEITRRLNRPDTFSAHYTGTDSSALLTNHPFGG